MRNTLLLACLLTALALTIGASAANLAAEASYQVTISGYAYQGQIIPGTNTPVAANGYAPAPPWQGPPETLTDGRRDGPAVVSWFWSSMAKQITVVFDLRRPVRVSAVRAWPRAGSTDRFDGGSFRVAADRAGLEAAADVPLAVAAEGCSWAGAALTGRYLRLTCASGAPQMSLAEVEIEGEATAAPAADAPPPGLVPVPPRDLAALTPLPAPAAGAANVMPRPEVKLTLTSQHYEDGRGMVDDDCAARSWDQGAALRDGKHESTLSSFSGWFAAKTITADLDLGGDYQVDRVVVWTTAEGPERSYLNALRLWVQPARGAPWQPLPEVRNPLLPGEAPGRPYPLVTPPLDRPARCLRLQLQGAAQSADLVRVTDLEVWARPLATPLPARPWRLKTPVAPISGQGVSSPLASLRWITRERLRALYTYVGQAGNDALLGRAVDAGYNALLVHTMGKSHSEAGWPEEVARWVQVQRHYPLRVIVSWPFGSDERYGNTQFGAYQPGTASLWTRTPCPCAQGYWEQVVGDRAVVAARAGLTGLVVDMEMYGADSTRYRGPCCCDDCWARFLANHLEGVPPREVAVTERSAWLEANGLAADYARAQELRVMALLRALERRVHREQAGFLLGNLLDLETLPGLACGFGTPTVPALVFSETEYAGSLAGLPERLLKTRTDYPIYYVPGFSPRPVLPARLQKLIPEAGVPSAGFWVWSSLAYDDQAPAEYGHAPGYPAEEYWAATKAGVAALLEAVQH